MKIKQLFIVFLGACLLCSSLTGTAQASKWGSILGNIFSGSDSGSSENYHPVSIVGKVIDSDEVPIQGIKVTIESEHGKSWSTHTDTNGNYKLNVLGAQNLIFTISGEGWRTIRWTDYIGSQKEQVRNGQLHHDYITGKVTDRNGNPMHWVKLTFEANGGTKGVVTVYTDEKGNYKATLPIDGYYWMNVSQDGYETYRCHDYVLTGRVWNFTLYEQ